jgi:hypothetical protein
MSTPCYSTQVVHLTYLFQTSIKRSYKHSQLLFHFHLLTMHTASRLQTDCILFIHRLCKLEKESPPDVSFRAIDGTASEYGMQSTGTCADHPPVVLARRDAAIGGINTSRRTSHANLPNGEHTVVTEIPQTRSEHRTTKGLIAGGDFIECQQENKWEETIQEDFKRHPLP